MRSELSVDFYLAGKDTMTLSSLLCPDEDEWLAWKEKKVGVADSISYVVTSDSWVGSLTCFAWPLKMAEIFLLHRFDKGSLAVVA